MSSGTRAGRAARVLAAAVVLGLAGCGGGDDPAEGDAADAQATVTSDTSIIYSLAIAPEDGSLLLSAGTKLLRVPAAGGEPETVEGSMATDAGDGQVKDLVLRYLDAKTLVASGHAVAPPLPQILGLARSTDGGMTWEPVSGLDDADYHELEVAGGRVLALRADKPEILVSDDGGEIFETRDPPADSPPLDVTVNPDDPKQWAVSSEQGVFVSTNDGRSWRQRDATFGPRLVWAKADALVSVGRDGKVRRSADSGRSWDEVGALPSSALELTAAKDGALYAVVAGGEIVSSPDGASWTSIAKAG